MFLRNAWYVAAWEREVGDSPYATTILGEHVAIYRGASGMYGALADACPHRKVPLSMGRVQGDNIECGYHGLVFDCAGACVRAPGNDRPPQGAYVRSYPIEPRYGLLWIWMGDAERADPADIFEAEHWGDPGVGIDRRRRHDRRLQLPAHHGQPAGSVACRLGAPRIVCR